MATVKIPVPKAGKEAYITIDTDEISNPSVYEAIVIEGLKACLNAGMTSKKVGAQTKLDAADLAKSQAAALEIATENFGRLKAGTFKFSGSRARGAEPVKVMNEAIRLAREVLKDQLKAANIPLKAVPAKDLTAAAKQRVNEDPKYIADAKTNLAARESVPKATLDLAALGIKVDETVVAKVAESKAARDERIKAQGLSKTQAGKVKPRAKPAATASVEDVLAGQGGNAPTHGHTHH